MIDRAELAKRLDAHAIRYANDYGYGVATDLKDAAELLRGVAQTAPEPAIVRQHIAWLYQYVQGMEASNWRDMKMNAERQLEQLSLMFPGRAHSSTDRVFPTDPNDPRYKMVGMGDALSSTHQGDAT